MRIPWTLVKSFPPINWADWTTLPNSAILDGVRTALRQIDSARNPRSAVLIVSDGGENSSQSTVQDIIKTRRQSETIIYAYRTSDFSLTPPHPLTARPDIQGQAPRNIVSTPIQSPDVLEELVGDSGGWMWSLKSADGANQASTALIDELRYQVPTGLHAGEGVRRQTPQAEDRNDEPQLPRAPSRQLRGRERASG